MDDEAGEYFWWGAQGADVHDAEGTQRSDEPVSKSMRNCLAGLPIER